MKKLGKRTLSFMLAAIFALLPIAGTGETETIMSNEFSLSVVSAREATVVVQNVEHYVSLSPASAGVGETIALSIGSSVSTTSGNATSTFDVELSSDLMDLIDIGLFTLDSNGNMTYQIPTAGAPIVLTLNDNHISYQLSSGQSVQVRIPLTTKNGISGNNVPIKVTPSVVPGAGSKLDDNSKISTPSTAEWKGTFAWSPVTKAATPDRFVVSANGTVSGAVQYTISANSLNTGDSGNVWTQEVVLQDTLTLPAGITLPTGARWDATKNAITDATGNTVYFALTSLPDGASVTGTPTIVTANGETKINFTVTAPNPNIIGNNAPTAEMTGVTLNAVLYMEELNGYDTLEENVVIPNDVTFAADAYNSDDAANSDAKAPVTVVGKTDDVNIGKTADSTIGAGEDLPYTITLTNGGTAASDSGKQVVDVLPAGLYLTPAQETAIKSNATSKGATADISTSTDSRGNTVYTITWTLPSIPAGGQIVFDFDTTVKNSDELTEANGFYGWFNNTARYDNDKSVTTTTKYEKPQVSVQKVNNKPDPVQEGELVTYTLTATLDNNVDGVTTLTDEMPQHLILTDINKKPIGATTNNNTETIGGYPATVRITEDGRTTIEWKVDWSQVTQTNAAGKKYIQMTVYATPSDIDQVYGSTLHNRFSSETDEEWSQITLDKDSISLEKTHTTAQEPVVPTNEITYTLTAKNEKDRKIDNVVVYDDMPSNIALKVGDKVYNTPNTSTTVNINGIDVLVTVDQYGATRLTWNIGTMAAKSEKKLIYTAVVQHTDGIVDQGNIRNTAITNKGDQATDDVPVSKPNVTPGKTHADKEDGNSFGIDDVVTFTMTATNSGSAEATNVTLKDVLPDGLQLVTDASGTVVVQPGTTTTSYVLYQNENDTTGTKYDNVECTVTKNSDGTTTVECKAANIPAGGRIEWVLYAKVTKNNTTTLTNTFYVDDTPTWDHVPIDDGLRHDKKIKLEDGTEVTSYPLVEGMEVTYVLKLINTTNEAKTFNGMVDYLPQTFGTFAFQKGVNVKTDGAFGDNWNVVANWNGPYEIQWYYWNSPGGVVVPAGGTVEEKVTLTFPTGEAWQNYLQAMRTNGVTKVTNRFTYRGVDKEVEHDVDTDPKQSVYMQKGVYNLAVQGQHDGNRYPTAPDSLKQYTPWQERTFVNYYFAVVNTGDLPIVITKAEDVLPEGLTLVGLFNRNDRNVTAVQSGGYYSRPQSYDAIIKVNGTELANQWNSEVLPAFTVGVNLGTVGNRQSIEFLFGQDGTGLQLERGQAIAFTYVCTIDGTKTSSIESVNTIKLHVEGEVERGKADITHRNDDASNLPANDGNCSDAVFDGTETTLTSSVTIVPKTGTHELYMQKGVARLGNMLVPTESWQQDKTPYYNQNIASSSLYQFSNGDTAVVYYFVAVNTGETPVTLRTATDALPTGVSYHGMIQNFSDFNVRKDGTNEKGIGNDYPADASGQLNHNIPNIAIDQWNSRTPWVSPNGVVTAAKSQDNNTVTFSFNNANGLTLKPGEAISFAYACVVDPTNALALSTNTINLIADGRLDVGVADISAKSSVAPNDGGCELVKYTEQPDGSNPQTELTSNVSIYKVGTDEIIPGITKELTGMKLEADDTFSAFNESGLSTNHLLQWTIKLYNDGINPMVIDWVKDTIDTPYKLIGDTAELVFYHANGTTTETTLTLAIPEGEVIGEGNDARTEYTFDLTKVENCTEAQRTLEAGGYAELKVVTKAETPWISILRRYNTAELKPNKTFTAHSKGDGHLQEGSTTVYETVSADDSFVIRGDNTTSSSKKVEEVGKPANQAISASTGTSSDEHITIDGTNRIVKYTLSVSNDGRLVQDTFGIIDNLPEPGDVGTKVGDQRGSEFTVKLIDSSYQASPVMLTMFDEKGNRVATPSYSLAYSTKVSDFTTDDYMGGNASAWQASMQAARSFRIVLNEPLPSGYSVEVAFYAEIQADADPGEIAWNTFGFYCVSGNQVGLAPAPPKVGVAIKSNDFVVEKIDGAGTALSGAEFVLYDHTLGLENGRLPAPEISEDGTRFTFKNMKPGTYVLLETVAPGGYVLGGEWWITVTDVDNKLVLEIEKVNNSTDVRNFRQTEDGTYECQIVNQLPPTLPSTGGAGTAWYTMAGLGLMLLALLGSRRLRVRAAKGGR